LAGFEEDWSKIDKAYGDGAEKEDVRGEIWKDISPSSPFHFFLVRILECDSS
jgi:hypothetical protein